MSEAVPSAAAAAAAAEPTGGRAARLRRAAFARCSGVRVVLECLEDAGNRAAILRTAEALGLLHVHEVRCVCIGGGVTSGHLATGALSVGCSPWVPSHL